MLTGESDGEFDILRIKDTNGIMVNILTLIGAVFLMSRQRTPYPLQPREASKHCLLIWGIIQRRHKYKHS